MAPTPNCALQPQCCEVCKSSEGLLRCAGCQVTYYCGREHQASHRATHKAPCNAVKKARDALDKEEKALRERPGDMMMPANVFENAVGDFYYIHETRPYMRARFALADKTQEQFPRSAAAVGATLEHYLAMMRLCHGDNMGLREIAPALMLRLGGRDQEVYDFLRWWGAGSEAGGNWDWGEDGENGGAPWVREAGAGADVLEEPDLWTQEHLCLSHAAAVLLIKIRLYLNLTSQDAMVGLGGSTVTADMLENVRGRLVDGGIVSSRPELVTGGLGATVVKVRGQIRELIDAISGSNRYFWPTMMMPHEALASPPTMYTFGSIEEAYLMVKYNYRSWEETPGALSYIKRIFKSVCESE